MAETIKGINVVIGSDTVGLSAALADVEKSSRGIQGELSKVERLLKFNPKDTTLLAQKQKLLGDQVATTREKLDRLKTAQAQVNEQFKKGDITEGQYRAFQREIVETTSKLKHYETQLKNTKDRSKEFADRLGALSTKLDGAGKALMPVSAAAGALAGGLLALGVNAGKAADDLNTMSKVTGLSTDTLQRFKYASDLIDVSTETLTGSLARLTRRMGDAQYGTERTNEAFNKLGVNIYDTNGNLRDNEDVFNDVINALGNVSSEAERDAIAMELFGRSAQDLNPLILGGADALKKLGDEAEKAGLILSQETLDSMNEVNDEIDKLKAESGATFAVLGTIVQKALLPVLQDLAGWLKNVMEWFRELDEGTIRIIATIAGLAAAIGPVLLVMAKMTTTIKTLIPVFKALTSSTGLWITAIAGLVTAGILLYKNWDTVKEVLLNIWDSIVYGVQQAISYMKTLLFQWLKMWVDAINSIGQYIPGLNSMLESAQNAIQGWIDAEKNAIKYRREERAETKAQTEALKQAEAELKANQEAAEELAIAEQKLTNTQAQQIQKTKEQLDAEKKLKENRLKFEADWHERLLRLNEQYSLSRTANAQEEAAMQSEILERQKQEALAKAEELHASTTDILAYYALEEQKILEKKNEALAASYAYVGEAFQGFVLSVGQGAKSLKEAIKEMVVSILSALQQQVAAAAFSAKAIAYAMSLGTFGASLGHLAVIAAKVLPQIAAIEALKAGIRGLAEGAVVTAPTLALIGERRDRKPEAVLPLTEGTYDSMGAAIAKRIPGQGGQGLTLIFNVHGNIIGDKAGMRKLAREVFSYEYSIKRRVGGAE